MKNKKDFKIKKEEENSYDDIIEGNGVMIIEHEVRGKEWEKERKSIRKNKVR